MICYVASVTVAQQSYAFVEKYEMVFLGCFGILVCLLILYIVRKNRQKTEAILQSAQTDELTQVTTVNTRNGLPKMHWKRRKTEVSMRFSSWI